MPRDPEGLSTASETARAQVHEEAALEKAIEANEEWRKEALNKISPITSHHSELPGMGGSMGSPASTVDRYSEIGREAKRRNEEASQKRAVAIEQIRSNGVTTEAVFNSQANPDSTLSEHDADTPNPLLISEAQKTASGFRDQELKNVQAWQDKELLKFATDIGPELAPSHHATAKAQMDQFDRIDSKAETAREQIEHHHDLMADDIIKRLPSFEADFVNGIPEPQALPPRFEETTRKLLDSKAEFEEVRSNLEELQKETRARIPFNDDEGNPHRDERLIQRTDQVFDQLAKADKRSIAATEAAEDTERQAIRSEGYTLADSFNDQGPTDSDASSILPDFNLEYGHSEAIQDLPGGMEHSPSEQSFSAELSASSAEGLGMGGNSSGGQSM